MGDDVQRMEGTPDTKPVRVQVRRPMLAQDTLEPPNQRVRSGPGVPQAIKGTQGVCKCKCMDHDSSTGAGWWRRIPARLWFALVVLTSPIRALVIVLDAILAASVVAIIGVAAAWWTNIITDDQVAVVLGQLGARGLVILTKSGII